MNRFIAAFQDLVNIFILRKLPCFYYDKVNNVGDRLNFFILKMASGKTPYIVRTRRFPHIIPVGSILHFSSRNSVIWGSGLISQDRPQRVEFSQILALRGTFTKGAIERQSGTCFDVPLGDPALLLPKYYQPKAPTRKFKIGIIPHYVDKDLPILEQIHGNPTIKVISVEQNHESFVDEVVSCEYILSSSLHGLIIADAYKIPNAWISLSDKILGGEFKFRDYYSTTTEPNEPCHYLESTSDMDGLIDTISSKATIKHYLGDLVELENALIQHIKKPRKLN